MKLTDKQKLRVADFLRGVAWDMGDIPDGLRRDRLRLLNQQIARRLADLHTPNPTDSEVDRVLEQCRPKDLPRPEALPEDTLEDIAAEPEHEEERVWLGVCAAIATDLALDPILVRAFFVVVGLTGPAAIMLYLVLFAAYYATGRLHYLPPIRWQPLAGFTSFAVVTALALFGVTLLLTELLRSGYTRLSDAPFHLLPYWHGILDFQTRWLMLCLVVVLPLAILGALPLANDWDLTWRKVVKAGLALYALVLSIALGSALAAVIIGVLEQTF
jgi:phage shock protein PspC (stress-responsive transcriptional regulator)